MRRPGPDPFAGADLVLVDGSNLLHALRRGPASLPPAALIGRIRAVIPPSAAVELVFDGAPEPGMRRTRVAAGVSVHYAAPVTADAAIIARAGRLDSVARERLLVVSDDGDLRAAIERLGARTARSRWLIGRLEREVLAAPAAGNRRSPASPRSTQPGGSDRDRDDSAPRWQPGRGATAKRGNPRRGHPPGR